MIKMTSTWRRRIFMAVGTATALYFLLFTYVWNVVFGLLAGLLAVNAPNSSFARNTLCKPGDWVLDTFQPMVSDKEMIDHLNKNREVMTRAAEIAGRQQNTRPEGGTTKEFDALVAMTGMRTIGGGGGSWSENPYSTDGLEVIRQCFINAKTQPERYACGQVERANGQGRIFTVHLEPAFGKTYSQYFCTAAHNSFKGYLYYPGGVPRIENGHVLYKYTYDDGTGTYITQKSERLVDNLDSNSVIKANEGVPVTRQIDDRWFITRN